MAPSVEEGNLARGPVRHPDRRVVVDKDTEEGVPSGPGQDLLAVKDVHRLIGGGVKVAEERFLPWETAFVKSL